MSAMWWAQGALSSCPARVWPTLPLRAHGLGIILVVQTMMMEAQKMRKARDWMRGAASRRRTRLQTRRATTSQA
jgi:hypothetical protein